MKNLKSALRNVLETVSAVAVSLQDGKIVMSELIKIGYTAIGWMWIFKHLHDIKNDIDTSTEEGMKTMVEELKLEFDIPQEALENVIETSLSILLGLISLIWKKRDQIQTAKLVTKK